MLEPGFLPGHPVVLTIDNIQIATLTASTSGYVTRMIDPAKLGLALRKPRPAAEEHAHHLHAEPFTSGSTQPSAVR